MSLDTLYLRNTYYIKFRKQLIFRYLTLPLNTFFFYYDFNKIFFNFVVEIFSEFQIYKHS